MKTFFVKARIVEYGDYGWLPTEYRYYIIRAVDGANLRDLIKQKLHWRETISDTETRFVTEEETYTCELPLKLIGKN